MRPRVCAAILRLLTQFKAMRESQGLTLAEVAEAPTGRCDSIAGFVYQAAVPPNAYLIEENLRGYVVLPSAHFQGFCRDLYTEAAKVVVSKVKPKFRLLFREQFTAHRHLDSGNPTYDHLKEDFKRFGFTLDLTVDPANVPLLAHLSAMNKWRNVAAHQKPTVPAGIPLDLAAVRVWRTSCDGLATSLDAILYNQLRRLLRRAPW